MSIMSNDQQNISSKLRFMDPQTLLNYGRMHKSDPYIFPLVFQENQNRRRLQMNQQMQAGAQPQPKVNEQALAQMAPQPMPEDLGIATLPAPNMKFGAEGGIMGYEGYGEEPQQFSQEPVVMMAEGGVARFAGEGASLVRTTTGGKSWFLDVPQTMPDPTVPYYREIPSPFAGLAGKEFASREEALAAYNQLSPTTAATSGAPVSSAAMAAKASASPYVTADPKNAEEAAMLNRYPTTKPAAKKDGAATKAATARPAKPAADAAAKDSADKEPTGLDALIQNSERMQDLARGEARNATVEYAQKLRDEGSQLVASEKKRISEEVDPYKDREARLLKQEKDSEKLPDKYLGLALLKASAEMMRTPGKFNFGRVVGAGISVGSESYIQGMEKINAAKDKFALAKEKLEDLRLNRSDMNKRDIKDAEKEARLLERQASNLFYTGAREDLNMKDKQIATMLGIKADDLKTTKTTASAEKIAAIGESGANARANAQIAATLNTPERQMWNQALAKHNGDTNAAFKELQTAKAEKFNPYQSYADYLKAFAGKDTTLTPPQDFSKYVSQFSIPTTTAPGKGATVLKQP